MKITNFGGKDINNNPSPDEKHEFHLSNVCNLQVRQAQRENGSWWYLALRAAERPWVCAHSWRPQLLLAGCSPVPVSSPSSMCLCLRFLSFSLPLQIFSNATEECSNVVEIVEQSYPVSRTVVFSFRWYFMKTTLCPAKPSPSNPTYEDQTLVWGLTIFAPVRHTLCMWQT